MSKSNPQPSLLCDPSSDGKKAACRSQSVANGPQNVNQKADNDQTKALSGKWKRAKFGDVCKVQCGYAFKSADYCENGIPLVRISNLVNGEVSFDSNTVFLPESKLTIHREFILKKGDTLIAMSGATTGKMAVFNADGPALLNQRVGRFQIQSESACIPGFISFLVKQITNKVLKEAYGAAQPNISPSQIEEMEIPLPPVIMQRRIVAEIEKQFTRLDAGVAALKRSQANLKRYRAALLKAACEGKLVPTEAELAKKEGRPFESGEMLLQRILSERRKYWTGRGKYKEPHIPDTANLPELPEGWVWATIEQLAAPENNSITDGPFGSNLKTAHYTDQGPRVIRLQNIGDGVFVDEMAHISNEHFESLQKHRVFAGDILIAGLGENPPRCCTAPGSLGPAIVKADCIRFKPHPRILSKFINAVMNSEPVRHRTKNIVHGVGRPRLNLGEIKSIIIPVPPLSEQKRLVAEVERHMSILDGLNNIIKSNLHRAACLRQSILQRAFLGELSCALLHCDTKC